MHRPDSIPKADLCNGRSLFFLSLHILIYLHVCMPDIGMSKEKIEYYCPSYFVYPKVVIKPRMGADLMPQVRSKLIEFPKNSASLSLSSTA